MEKDLGIARCGLACCLCSENDKCTGCKGDSDKHSWCKNFKCSIDKNIEGCYFCDNTKCRDGMFKDKIKPLAFCEFIRRYGKDELLKCLERNENIGIVYHRKGIIGDYDDFNDIEDLISFISSGKRVIIETERLFLRQLNNNDFNNLKSILSDNETMKYYPEPYDDEGVDKWLEWNYACYKKRGFGLWAVELKDGTFIGDTGITLQNIDGKEVFEIGYHFNKKYWGNGYAIEAAKACKEWFFKNSEYDEVYSYMNIDNDKSRNVAIRNGMSFIKEYEDHGQKLAVYRIRKEDFNKVTQ